MPATRGDDERRLAPRTVKIGAAGSAAIRVARTRLSGKPPHPGLFPTDKDDERPRAVDDRDR